MSIYLKVNEWISIIQKEYLQDFIKSGGAAVKFIVPEDMMACNKIRDLLRQLAESEGFLFTFVDSRTTKTHMMEKIFHQIAKQLDWNAMAYSFLSHILSDSFKLPSDLKDFNLREIASLNEKSEVEMLRSINNKLKTSLYKDYSMTQEFRIAMLRLCEYQLDAKINTVVYNNIIEWLQGELHDIDAIKSELIFQKIWRHNARHMLLSLSHWVKLSGKSGLVLMLDISRYTEGKRPKEPDINLYYNTPAVKDGYELLRQFIDGTDDMEYGFICVMAAPNFWTDKTDKIRGLWAYEALGLRIWDEVHDKLRVNPMSSLIRLAPMDDNLISEQERR